MSASPRVWLATLGVHARAGDAVRLEGDPAHHLVRVSRARANDAVVLFDGRGREARARVLETGASRHGAWATLALTEDARAGVSHDTADVIWLQGYPKGDKLDTVVREATELGARAIWPVFTARSVPRAKGPGDARHERLESIARAAAEQCGRADVPAIAPARDLAAALAALPTEVSARLLPWEEGGVSLASALRGFPATGGCAVLVGPEGGITEDEAALARAHGFVAVTLGPRIWRTETVAPALLAVLSFARGDLRK